MSKIRKPLLVIPSGMQVEFETVTKAMRLTSCQKCRCPIPVGHLRLNVTMGSARAATSCKLCHDCAGYFFSGMAKVMEAATHVAQGAEVNNDFSPRKTFVEDVGSLLPRSSRCPACEQRVTCDPSGHTRNHKDKERLPCPGSGKKSL